MFDLVAFFQGPLYFIWASILPFYNYCVCSEVIRCLVLWWGFIRYSAPAIVLSVSRDTISREIRWKPPEGHPRENFSLSWQPHTVCVTLFRFSSLTKKQSHPKIDSFAVWVHMENTFASFHLNVASNSIWVSQGCTWRIRFLPDTKQKYSQSSLITTLYAKITFQSKGEKVISSSVLGLITDYHSMRAETKKFSLLPLEVTPSLPFVLHHTHLQPQLPAALVRSAFSRYSPRPCPDVFTSQSYLLGLKEQPFGLWIKGLHCHLYIQHPILAPNEANEAAAPTL